jgi:hypothetical protein
VCQTNQIGPAHDHQRNPRRRPNRLLFANHHGLIDGTPEGRRLPPRSRLRGHSAQPSREGFRDSPAGISAFGCG